MPARTFVAALLTLLAVAGCGDSASPTATAATASYGGSETSGADVAAAMGAAHRCFQMLYPTEPSPY